MYQPLRKGENRRQIHRRIRKKIKGRAERPRLSVFRSLRQIYAQLIDDRTGRTLASASTREKDIAGGKGGDIAAASEIGKRIAERARQAGIHTVIFDRGGYRYQGRVKALAEAARKVGLVF